MTQFRTLRLILGDQLNASHTWYQQKRDDVLYLLAELNQEMTYVRHHKQKVAAFFAAMEAFANGLKQAGHQVLHLDLDATAEYVDLPDLIQKLMSEHGIEQFEYQRPDELRLLNQLRQMPCSLMEYDTEHFFLPFEEFDKYIKPQKHSKLEFFYRKLRKRFDILMNGDEPRGGQWNFDADNRKSFKKADIAQIPEPLLFANPVAPILERLERHEVKTLGTCEEHLLWPVTRAQSKALLQHFCKVCLPKFGHFQDAMTCNSEHSWSLYHSRISFALNAKMLSPQQVLDSAIIAFENDPEIDIAQIEGFVRQILGWREFVRVVYWQNAEYYREANYFNASKSLPSYFWDGDTKMQCMKQSIGQSLDFAYAHHIQRLMITGNFCLLAGIEPSEVDDWYLGIYIDAIEWVEMPNTRGMALFADGGLFASKPYAGSGAYINRMSDYCKSCHYNVKEKVTEDACPFNSLYWHFMNRNRTAFGNNPRMTMPFRNWDKMAQEQQDTILNHADGLLEKLDQL